MSVGFTYHTIDGEDYWIEDAYYEFTAAQIDKLESVTKELSDMCFKAVDYVIKHNLFAKLKLSEESAELVRRYWDADAPTLYGRFDLGWNGVGEPKMYEFNEAAVETDNPNKRSLRIHPDRVLIWSDDGTVNGRSLLEPGYNDLIDLEKIKGAGGEGFWKNAKSSPVPRRISPVQALHWPRSPSRPPTAGTSSPGWW